jgi:hypothetical protein
VSGIKQTIIDDDATSRCITAAITYIEQLLKERGDLKQDLSDLPATCGTSNWQELLALPINEISGVQADATCIEKHLRKLKQLRFEYLVQLNNGVLPDSLL